MNYLDLLPDDVTKIINRKVQDLQIINRRTERKQNKITMREQKRIADNKKEYIKNSQDYMKNIHILKERKNWTN